MRRLLALVEGLPANAAVNRTEGQEWGATEELLALVTERVDAWGLLHARINTDKKFHKYLPDKPLEVARPGRRNEQEDRVITDPREIAKFFG